MASRGKRTFWVTSAPTAEHQARANLLGQNGFDVNILAGAKDVVDAIAHNRPTCIIVDAVAQRDQASVQVIKILAKLPELNGVRFILSTAGETPEATKVATAENYRDIIPLNLPMNLWLQRFQYATATRPIDFHAPLCEISMNQVAVAFAPARIVWVSDTHIRIECRGGQHVGTTMQITGEIAKAFGVPYISLTVESVHRQHLIYRFSQALVCRWRVADTNTEKAKLIIRRMHLENPHMRLRAFVAMTKPDLRKLVVQELNRDRVDVKVALQRSTLSDEFAYFSPDIVFLDEKILGTLDEIETQLMLARLPGSTPIVIYGAQSGEKELQRIFGKRKIHVEHAPLPEHLRNAADRYKITPQKDSETETGHTTQIPQDHPWSKIELQIPARLTSLNPSVGRISLPFSLGAYASARLEAPILRKALGRDPYIKITAALETTGGQQNSQFNHHGHFYLADVDRTEQLKLSQVLSTMLEGYYEKQFETETAEVSASAQVMALSQGSLALKNTEPGSGGDLKTPVRPSLSNSAPAVRPVIRSTAELDAPFNWRKYVDVTIVKAIVVIILAFAVMAAILNMAINVDPSFYKDNGREYSDFFRRMSDPQFRKNNPVPSAPEK